MLVQCWTYVYDVGPTLDQHWFNVSCLLGYTVVQRKDFVRQNVDGYVRGRCSQGRDLDLMPVIGRE